MRVSTCAPHNLHFCAPPLPQAWFHLYRILLTADDLAPAEVAPTVEQFMLSAPLGEFASRLSLLEAFKLQLADLAAAGESAEPGTAAGAEAGAATARRQRWRGLAALLSNVVRYYRQFEPAVQRQIAAGMAELEKALQVRSCAPKAGSRAGH